MPRHTYPIGKCVCRGICVRATNRQMWPHVANVASFKLLLNFKENQMKTLKNWKQLRHNSGTGIKEIVSMGMVLIPEHTSLNEIGKLSKLALKLSYTGLSHYIEELYLDWDESLTVKFRKPVQLGDMVEKAVLDLVYPICGCMDYYVMNDDGTKIPWAEWTWAGR